MKGFLASLRLHHDRLPGAARSGGPGGHELFQVGTIDALLAGGYDGSVTIAEIGRHGDFGVGTFTGLDGEMVAVDGVFFQMTADGSVRPASPELTTPFAVVLPFTPGEATSLPPDATVSELRRSVLGTGSDEAGYQAVRVDGRFARIDLRSVPRQEKPYPPLVEAAEHQAEFHFSDVTGSLIGFRYPDAAVGVGVVGFHLHFLSSDRTVGGHVLDFRLDEGTVAVDETSRFHLELSPDAAPDGGARREDRDRDIAAVEGLES